MARCYTEEDCKRMIKKIKQTKLKYPKGFNGIPYDYWCPSCDCFNSNDFCHCDNDN